MYLKLQLCIHIDFDHDDRKRYALQFYHVIFELMCDKKFRLYKYL